MNKYDVEILGNDNEYLASIVVESNNEEDAKNIIKENFKGKEVFFIKQLYIFADKNYPSEFDTMNDSDSLEFVDKYITIGNIYLHNEDTEVML